MKPRIGLNCDIDDSGRLRARIAVTYSDLVIQHGGTPLMIPPGVAPEEVTPILDGVLLIGGDDYRCGLDEELPEPHRFEPVHPMREKLDLQWANFALDCELPILAICGGFQLLAIAAGGTIFGDIEQEAAQSDSTVAHRVLADDEELPIHEISWFTGLPGTAEPGLYQVNSSHHQSVNQLPSDWLLLATSHDGIIEAACDESRRIVGVQWHPEQMLDEPLGKSIVDWFIESCKVHSSGRT